MHDAGMQAMQQCFQDQAEASIDGSVQWDWAWKIDCENPRWESLLRGFRLLGLGGGFMVLCTLGLDLQGVQKRADGDLLRVLEQWDPNRGLGIARQDLELSSSSQEVTRKYGDTKSFWTSGVPSLGRWLHDTIQNSRSSAFHFVCTWTAFGMDSGFGVLVITFQLYGTRISLFLP